uniref:Endonuclease/exonuclease/phosphatase domain-containing protein n=1 Tax=Chromera velia CCMP2878 TaxID=1169474 RepID=A0A0G4HYP1_9ALVE|eukprot:Cvel_9524.t1-p1 / transcript=Cvel_9524.t1 / gene=Cvel_9524 / organism=Chromera_velia_CCMP2878 / gene_product=Carbon catabolite repressor protein 4 homolog 1, putative / transcript_product=Carbon catabolite repressor protein 4 homolog 1, putative / location=Cvel_scaffold551:49961-56720(-) / protein_length=638 / sequence_SO=supercontig / SO=protein_coding / is_pseudo=false
MSYNIMHKLDSSRVSKYFYAAPRNLNPQNRIAQIAKEVQTYKPDFLCLQEAEEESLRFLNQVLGPLGYREAVRALNLRLSSRDGCAILFRETEGFRVERTHTFRFCDVMERFGDEWRGCGRSELREALWRELREKLNLAVVASFSLLPQDSPRAPPPSDSQKNPRDVSSGVSETGSLQVWPSGTSVTALQFGAAAHHHLLHISSAHIFWDPLMPDLKLMQSVLLETEVDEYVKSARALKRQRTQTIHESSLQSACRRERSDDLRVSSVTSSSCLHHGGTEEVNERKFDSVVIAGDFNSTPFINTEKGPSSPSPSPEPSGNPTVTSSSPYSLKAGAQPTLLRPSAVRRVVLASPLSSRSPTNSDGGSRDGGVSESDARVRVTVSESCEEEREAMTILSNRSTASGSTRDGRDNEKHLNQQEKENLKGDVGGQEDEKSVEARSKEAAEGGGMKMAESLQSLREQIEAVMRESPPDEGILSLGDYGGCGGDGQGASSGVYDLMTKGLVTPDHPHHPNRRRATLLKKAEKRLLQDSAGSAEQTSHKGGIPELRTRREWGSAYKEAFGSEPEFTNYTAHFKGCLDFIFFSNLEVVAALEMPREDLLRESTALPSSCFPSDHLPLMASFALNPPTTRSNEKKAE